MLTIIGNKIDLCENDDTRVVRYKDGAHLADVIYPYITFNFFSKLILFTFKENGSLFFEVSSKESKYVVETMEAIARILTEKEDKQMEDVLNLKMKEKKKTCCSLS